VLEGVAIELSVVIEVVGVCKEVVSCAEYITAAHIRAWQAHLFRPGNFEAIFGLTIERFSHFVSQVGIGVFVSNDLYGIVDACSAMVGSEYDFVS
jgi:hypothetical protein